LVWNFITSLCELDWASARRSVSPDVTLHRCTFMPFTGDGIEDLLPTGRSYKRSDRKGLYLYITPAGSEFWWINYRFENRQNPRTDRLFFVRGLPPAPRRTHHLHVSADPDELARHVRFRDHLNTHADERSAFEALKRELAVRYRGDREAYSQAKRDWIRAVEARARAAQSG